MAGIRTNLSIPTQPWKTAKARFLQGLTPEEVAEFKDATPENLFYRASAVQKKHAAGSKTWLLQERLASFVDGIDEYGKALDVFPNMCPLILAPLWGSVRIVLQITSEAGKFQEKIVDMLAQIGDVLPRFHVFEKIFSKHERLLAALADAYLDVLQFCVYTKDFFLRGRKSYIPLTIVVKGAWKTFRTNFEQNMLTFRKHQKKVEKEADLAHKIDAARARELERVRGEMVKQDLRIRGRHKMITSLPAVDFQAKHRKLCELRHPGTNTWLLSNSRFQTWLNSPKSDCLPCYGIPGSGKSVLVTTAANEVQCSFSDAQSLLLYYYSDYSDPDSLELHCVIASLIKQILVHLPLHYFDEEFACPYAFNLPTPERNQMVEFLRNMFGHFNAVYIFIDGLDEFKTIVQQNILTLIHTLIDTSKGIMKCFVTSRSGEHEVRRSLQNFESITLSNELISSDIELFIQEQMVSRILRLNPLMQNERLKGEVVDALVQGAQGMFLWVTFQLYEVEEALTEKELYSIIGNLPKSLFDTYLRIIKKTLQVGGQERLNVIKRAFRWVALARRPLHLDEFQEAVGIDKEDKCFPAENIAVNAGERLIKACGNLVVHNRSDDTVTFAHHSVKQFLTSTPSENTSSAFESIRVDPYLSSMELGEICLAYLSFADFETQVVRVAKPAEVPRQDIEHMVWGAVPFANLVKNTIMWGRSSQVTKGTTENQQIDLHVPSMELSSEILTKKYKLLGYIIAFWIHHAAAMTTDLVKWNIFRHFVLYKELLFEFRPWLENEYRSEITEYLHRLCADFAPLKAEESRLLGWFSKPLEMNAPLEVCDELSMYTWAIRNDFRPLLSIVRFHNLEKYFAWKYGPDGDFLLLGSILFSRSLPCPVSESIWSADFILAFCEAVLGKHFSLQTLGFLKNELESWKGPTCPSFDELRTQAIIRASKENRFHNQRAILTRWHCRTPEQYAQLLVALSKHGLLGPRIGMQDISTGDMKDGLLSYRTFFELAFALDSYLRHLACPSARFLDFPALNLPYDILFLLLVLVLSTPEHLEFAKKLIVDWKFLRAFEDGGLVLATFDLPDMDWNWTPPGSTHICQNLKAMEGLDILQIAFVQARRFCVPLRLKYSDPEYIAAMDRSEWKPIWKSFEDYFPGHHTSDPCSGWDWRSTRTFEWTRKWEIFSPLEDPIMISMFDDLQICKLASCYPEFLDIPPRFPEVRRLVSSTKHSPRQ